jgi:hypothetical protein
VPKASARVWGSKRQSDRYGVAWGSFRVCANVMEDSQLYRELLRSSLVLRRRRRVQCKVFREINTRRGESEGCQTSKEMIVVANTCEESLTEGERRLSFHVRIEHSLCWSS